MSVCFNKAEREDASMQCRGGERGCCQLLWVRLTHRQRAYEDVHVCPRHGVGVWAPHTATGPAKSGS